MSSCLYLFPYSRSLYLLAPVYAIAIPLKGYFVKIESILYIYIYIYIYIYKLNQILFLDTCIACVIVLKQAVHHIKHIIYIYQVYQLKHSLAHLNDLVPLGYIYVAIHAL